MINKNVAYWVALWSVYSLTYVLIILFTDFHFAFDLALYICSLVASVCAGVTAKKIVRYRCDKVLD